MDSKLKIKQLRNIINKQLLSLIDYDYIYLDLPFHANIGDSLIWEGTLEFLKQLPYKCLYTSSYDTYLSQSIDRKTIILLHGGGNWGDLYPRHHEFRKKIIKEYPQNRIIILPQTIYYPNSAYQEKDIIFFNQYPNVTICVRDKKSYEIAKNNFSQNPIILIPDMAFFIPYKRIKHNSKNVLFLKRNDKELPSNIHITIPKGIDMHDWPTTERDFWYIRLVNIVFGTFKKIITPFNLKLAQRIKDFKYNCFIRKFYVNIGSDFINHYDTIYTTRLHGMILSILLDKQIYLIDNSYGKNFNFYHTWLEDLDSVQLIESDN